MKFNKLGSSDLVVSEVCLGTMTWGVQNTEQDAHEQLDYAIKTRKVNFIDTAEVYPVPSSASAWVSGRTEEYIGSWFAANPGIREKVILATKVSGFNPSSKTVGNRFVPPRNEEAVARLDRKSVLSACEGSLRRLQTSYIDLYQIHWPDRYVPLWGARVYDISKIRSDWVPIEETASALKELLETGKIRAYGLSNETAYGVCEWCRVADKLKMPRPATIQNHFSLLERSFEGQLAEACSPSNYNIGLLPWSILGGGVLSGKFIGKIASDGSVTDPKLMKTRFALFPVFQGRFRSPAATDAIERYDAIAKEAGMTLATMAHAFCKTRWYIPSTIIGATSMSQLKENIDAFEVELTPETMEKINSVHKLHMDPCLYP